MTEKKKLRYDPQDNFISLRETFRILIRDDGSALTRSWANI